MELVLNTFETEPLPEPRETFIYTNEPLLNSNYKAAVEQNFIKSSKPSVFSIFCSRWKDDCFIENSILGIKSNEYAVILLVW